MKIRICGDSIRLRLKRSEVEQLASGEPLVEQTHFPGSMLQCRLESTEDSEFSAAFGDNLLSIRLSAVDVSRWATSDKVSLFTEQDVGGSSALSLLVEKDFQCLSPGHHRTGEEDEDTYPHPDAGTDAAC